MRPLLRRRTRGCVKACEALWTHQSPRRELRGMKLDVKRRRGSGKHGSSRLHSARTAIT
jgi:hypothetical protein